MVNFDGFSGGVGLDGTVSGGGDIRDVVAGKRGERDIGIEVTGIQGGRRAAVDIIGC